MLVGPSIGGIKMRLQNFLNAGVSIGLELMFKPTMASTIAIHEGFFLSCFTCTCLVLSHDRHVETQSLSCSVCVSRGGR
jgi:hypothetical protein